MKKIILTICLIAQNCLLFASAPDTLVLHEDETKLLTSKYVQELEDPSGTLKVHEIISAKNFHTINSSLPLFRYSKSITWLKFILKNKTTRAFVPVTIGTNIVISSFDMYFEDHRGGSIIHLSSAVPYRDTKLIKHSNTFINAIIFPDSVRTIYLRIASNSSGVVPVEVNSANTFFKNADFENILVGGFMGITLVMALYNLVLFIILRDRSYLYYVCYIVTLGLSQVLLRGYGSSFFVSEKAILNNYLIPIVRVGFGFSVLLFAAEFLQLKRILKSYIYVYYVLYTLYSIALVSIFAGKVVFANDLITIVAGLMAVALLGIGILLYFRGFKPAQYFMYGWGLFFITILISIAHSRGLIAHNEFTVNLIIYSYVVQLVLFSIALAARINFYRREHSEAQQLSLAIAKENERLITEQNILLESEVNARTQQLINTNQSLSKIIEDLKSTQIKLVETEKMASLGQLTAGIAHEINNPINFVSSNVTPLRLDFLEIFDLIDKYREAGIVPGKNRLLNGAARHGKTIDVDFIKKEILSLLDGIEDGATRTTEIVQSLRSFSRTDELVLKYVDINKAILNTLILLRSTIPYYIEIKPVLNKLPLLNCYPGKVNQVLMNLINNSIQAITEKGQSEHDSIVITTADHPGHITIEIEDSGIGMRPEVKQRIFEPFYTTKNVGEGTGLGLSIVFGIIEDHHGSIDVRSEPGKGTTFIITLPKYLE